MTESRCDFCKDPLPAGHTTCCGSAECLRAQEFMKSALREQRQLVKEVRQCRLCKSRPAPGKPWCEAHRFVKVPCRTLGCTGKVERQIQAGRPKTLCPKCQPKGRRHSFNDSAGGA